MQPWDSTRPSEPPTPAIVIDVPMLETFVTRFQQALATYWPNSILSYSFKTNSLPWLISFMRERDVWAEVVSDTEYQLALALGYTRDRVVYNGPVKGREQLRSALQQDTIINLDAKREVSWTAEIAREMPDRTFAVGLRVNWDLNERCPGESTSGGEDSRFGFNADNTELDDAIAELTSAGVRIAGLHMHRNSLTQSLGVFQAAATVAAEIITARGLDLDWIDIGGGFFGNEVGSPTFDEYIEVVRQTLERVVDVEKTTLIVEPGGSLVAAPVEFHASVIDSKEIKNNTWIVTDASRTNIDPLFRRQRPFKVTLDTQATETRSVQHIGGFTCMEDDHLMKLHDAPALAIGDRIVFHKVGGYTMCYQSMLFIDFPPPVYARTNRELIQVRRRWTVDEYLQATHMVNDSQVVDTALVIPST